MLLEYYESGNAPHEALGRAARRLAQGGALYLGGGVGIEKLTGSGKAETYSLTKADGKGKAESFGGPLSAVMRGFAVAGGSTAPDTPGGSTAVADPAAAARLRELADQEQEAKQSIERMTRRLASRKASPAQPWSPGVADDDAWEARRLNELRAELAQVAAERSKLLAGGKMEEVEQERPGTNFTKIPPKNVAKLSGIVNHYKGMAHPFTACVRDQMKHGLSQDHANRRCAVVTDLGKGTTKWRKGSKKVEEAAEQALEEALARVATVESTLGAGMAFALAEGVPGAPPRMAALGEAMAADMGLLALAGHPVASMLYEAFSSGGAMANGSAKAPSAAKDARRRTGPAAAKGSGGSDDEKHPRGKAGTSEGGRFVSKGSGSNEQVRTVQHHLHTATDGNFGDKTKQAVMDFQKAHGLQVDGIVGHQTAVALAGGDGKNAKVGALKGSDEDKLKRLRSKQTRKGSAPERSRGGVKV